MSAEKFKIRPQSLDDYVGQEHLKEQVSKVIHATKVLHDAFPHTLLTGPAGCGKTSFAEVIANERGVECVPLFASSIKVISDIKEILRTRLNADGYVRNDPEPRIPTAIKPTVLFIDEIHRLPMVVREALYTVMEDRVYWEEEKSPWSGRKQIQKTWVPKFSLIGATTREGTLEKPFLDRFELRFKLVRYTVQECEHFVRRAAKEMGNFQFTSGAVTDIAKRARGTARVAIQLIRAVIKIILGELKSANGRLPEIDTRLTQHAFAAMQIDEQGLTPVDMNIMLYLYKCYRPVGLKGLAAALEETVESIERIYEPFLVSQDMIRRLPSGRVISDCGVDYLRKLNLVPQSEHRYIEEGVGTQHQGERE